MVLFSFKGGRGGGGGQFPVVLFSFKGGVGGGGGGPAPTVLFSFTGDGEGSTPTVLFSFKGGIRGGGGGPALTMLFSVTGGIGGGGDLTPTVLFSFKGGVGGGTALMVQISFKGSIAGERGVGHSVLTVELSCLKSRGDVVGRAVGWRLTGNDLPLPSKWVSVSLTDEGSDGSEAER